MRDSIVKSGDNENVKNFKERIWFIKYWVDFVKKSPDKIWSKGQADFIDSQIQSSNEFHANLNRKRVNLKD